MPVPGEYFRIAFHAALLWMACGLTLSAQVKRENGIMKDGKKEGVWEFFYPDGVLMAREYYFNGLLHGEALSFHPNGSLAQKENWKNDVLQDSAWYFHPNGKIHRQGIYLNGVYNGCWLTYFPGGKLEQQGCYENGQPEGLFTNWYESGNLRETGHYHEGRKEGQFVFYRDDRKEKISILASYCNNVPCGLWIWFNRRGKPAISAPAPSQ